MKKAFCTITTVSHLYKTRALIKSISRFYSVEFYVLVIDGALPNYHDANYVELSFLKNPLSTALIKKYKKNKDHLRWALKPMLMHELLKSGFDKVIYSDNDICYYASPHFLFEKLNESAIILTPQNYSFDPTKDQIWMEANFLCGLYNAGFVGASNKGLPALTWWANCCLYNMKQVAWRGLYDDQKYLDLMPILFDEVAIIKHKGCNISGWNLENNKRVQKRNEVIIAPDYEIIFIHFTPLFFRNIAQGKDQLLLSYHNEYINLIHEFNSEFTVNSALQLSYVDYWLSLKFHFWKLKRWLDQ